MGAEIVQAALARAGLATAPESPRELSEFVQGSLSPEVERRLGDDAATELEQRMAMVIHVLGRASRAPAGAPPAVDEFGPEPASETRPVPTARPPAPVTSTAPPMDRPTVPPDPSGAITVSSDAIRNLALAVVSPDSKLVGRVREALGDGGEASSHRTLADLASAVAGSLDAVLIDRRGSAPSATLTLPESIRGAQVVLWPAKSEAATALGTVATHVASVTAYGADVGVEDVVVLVRLSAARRRR